MSTEEELICLKEGAGSLLEYLQVSLHVPV